VGVKNEYDALAWALDKVFQGTNVKVIKAKEVELATGPVELLDEKVWDEEEISAYYMRHAS
jgi:hypothetical protein